MINVFFFKRDIIESLFKVCSGWSENIIEIISNFLFIIGFIIKYIFNNDIFGIVRDFVFGNDFFYCFLKGFGVIFMVIN